MFFASPIGLGHATRDIAIAQEMPSCDVRFVSGLGAARMIAGQGYPVQDVYSPAKFVVESGELRNSFKWLMDYYSYYNKCREIVKTVLDNGNQLPAGAANGSNGALIVSDEDFASISVAQEIGRKGLLITDITETRFTKGPASILERKMNRALRELIRKCDRVIIPDNGQDRENIVHVGPIVRKASASRDELRKRFGFNKRTILVSIGGTDAGRYLIERALAAYRSLKDKIDADLVVVSGPSLQLEAAPDFRSLGFVDNLHELVFAADLVVSLAGRSTMDESIAFGTPGIFIPIKGHFEQENGAARLGFVYEDINRLEALIEEKLAAKTQREMSAGKPGGAAKAAAIISSYLS